MKIKGTSLLTVETHKGAIAARKLRHTRLSTNHKVKVSTTALFKRRACPGCYGCLDLRETLYQQNEES
jgi:hypothetical protein